MATQSLATMRFNRWCRVVVFAWLVVGMPLTFKFRPVRYHDLGQFYMGGLIARHAAWDSLYPIPHPDSPYNPGLAADSDRPPVYAELADQSGVGNDPRFIQPPPDALLFAPLALFSYHKARWIWIVLNGLCGWGIAMLAGKFYELAAGRPSRIAGALTLLVGCSYLMYTALRGLNLEAPMGLLLGVATLEILRRDGINGAAGVALGALLKYATLLLLPVAAALRRWRTLAWTGLLLTAAIAGSWLVMGSGPFREFARLAPLLARPYEDEPNQSLTGFLLRITHTLPLPMGIARGVQITGILAFLALCLLIVRRLGRKAPAMAVDVFAAAAALIGWMLIFNPLVWNKYHLLLCPFWGWLVWEARQSKWRLALAIFAIAMVWGTWHMMWDLPEPFNSHMLWGAMAMVAIAVVRLARSPLNSPNHG